MKRLPFFVLIFFLVSCQTVPVIHKQDYQTDHKNIVCPHPFLKDKYRLVHTIEVRMAGNVQNAVMGVTLINPFTRSVSCAIITPEGIVLFEAETGPAGINVKRALPPFDSETIAKNMMEDISLIFLTPEGKVQDKGFLEDGSVVCRYLKGNGDRVDVIDDEKAGKQIRRYASSGTLERHVILGKTTKSNYQHVELLADGIFDYSLLMNLVEAEKIK